VHVVELKLPVLSVENVTIPEGVAAVPPSVSVTVAVHVVASLTDTEDGEHAIEVEVVRVVAVSAKVLAAMLAE
jgi:hypothetical protein